MAVEELALRLKKYLPASTETDIARWIIFHKVHFRITQPRNSKYGDYRHPYQGKGHMITVNGDLNTWSFFITAVHEFAHLQVWEKYKNTVAPHGKEWKQSFHVLMNPFIQKKIFPDELEQAIVAYLKNPAAGTCVDANLSKALRKFDTEINPFLEELMEGSRFRLNEKTFVKGKKRRSRFVCKELLSGNEYLISATAEVEPAELF